MQHFSQIVPRVCTSVLFIIVVTEAPLIIRPIKLYNLYNYIYREDFALQYGNRVNTGAVKWASTARHDSLFKINVNMCLAVPAGPAIHKPAGKARHSTARFF